MNITGIHRRPLRLISVLLALVAFAVVGCSSSTSPSPGGQTATARGGTVISLKLLSYMPMDMAVKVGTTVTWRNDEPITHTVTSGQVTGVDATSGLRTGQKPDGLFSATLKTRGSTFSYTFTKPGTYTYYCNIHYGMRATITVTN
jgi:plastocyanin